MERVVCKHVCNHLHSNKLIYEYKSGVLHKHSTVHQLIELYKAILNSLVVLYLVIFRKPLTKYSMDLHIK
jgi:hypothetical protein